MRGRAGRVDVRAPGNLGQRQPDGKGVGGTADRPADPRPTPNLPAFTNLDATAAIRIDATPSPDFIILADGYAFASGVGSGIGRFDGMTGALLDSVVVPGGTCEALDAGFGTA